MDQTERDTPKEGPALANEVQEIQGKFPNDDALQDALSRLTLLGFDHADFSLPDLNAPTETPDEGASAATDDIDTQQVRTMASGLTGATAGVAVAGVLAATGGVAAPLIAAAAGASALGAAAATTGAGVVADQANSGERDRLGAEGKLVLAVRTRTAERVSQARQAMEEAGAIEVRNVERAEEALTRGVNATSWTGG